MKKLLILLFLPIAFFASCADQLFDEDTEIAGQEETVAADVAVKPARVPPAAEKPVVKPAEKSAEKTPAEDVPAVAGTEEDQQDQQDEEDLETDEVVNEPIAAPELPALAALPTLEIEEIDTELVELTQRALEMADSIAEFKATAVSERKSIKSSFSKISELIDFFPPELGSFINGESARHVAADAMIQSSTLASAFNFIIEEAESLSDKMLQALANENADEAREILAKSTSILNEAQGILNGINQYVLWANEAFNEVQGQMKSFAGKNADIFLAMTMYNFKDVQKDKMDAIRDFQSLKDMKKNSYDALDAGAKNSFDIIFKDAKRFRDEAIVSAEKVAAEVVKIKRVLKLLSNAKESLVFVNLYNEYLKLVNSKNIPERGVAMSIFVQESINTKLHASDVKIAYEEANSHNVVPFLNSQS